MPEINQEMRSKLSVHLGGLTSRQKYWEELSADEKATALLDYIETSILPRLDDIYDQFRAFERHEHNAGGDIMVPLQVALGKADTLLRDLNKSRRVMPRAPKDWKPLQRVAEVIPMSEAKPEQVEDLPPKI